MSPELYKILPGIKLPGGGAEEVGNKAWNLMRMTAAGLPVPAAFVLPAGWSSRLRSEPDHANLKLVMSSGIADLETATGLRFGSRRRPLLVSVRSGSAASMPGMLETVLNIGINTDTVEGLIASTGNPRLAWDCYRRLVQNYAEVVEHLPRGPFDELVNQAVVKEGVEAEHELGYDALRRLTNDLLERFRELRGLPFVSDPFEQLERATVAVFDSWRAPKAIAYRNANGIAHDSGTAATIQRMVFGNAGGASGAGVAFTRNPATGVPELYLDFEFNTQGEDVVAGRFTACGSRRLRSTLPLIWTQLERTAQKLEALFRDAQDFEFTLQSGRLYLLQTRSARRTSWAALRIAVDQVDECLISPAEAMSRLASIDLDLVARTRLEVSHAEPLAMAQVAAIGIAVGVVALDSIAAKRMASTGAPVILVRRELETDDIDGIINAAGILTATGSRTCHASVVARQLNKVCLVACPGLEIDLARRSCRIGGKTIHEGEFLCLDGNAGAVYAGRLAMITERPERELFRIARWKSATPVLPQTQNGFPPPSKFEITGSTG